jgi:uncharacterized protein YggE
METRHWIIVLAALAIVAASSIGVLRTQEMKPVVAAEVPDEHIISVNGEAQLSVKPDIVVIRIGVTTQASTAQASMAENATRMNALIAALSGAGVKKEEMRTISFNVHPVYEYPHNAPAKLVGFRTTNSLLVTVSAEFNVGGLLDRAAAAGSNQIDSVSYQVRDLAKHRDEALAKAMADARHRAEVLARSAGVTIKGVKSVAESGGYQPRPEYEYMRAAKAMADTTPMLAGELVIQFNVTVQYIF